MCSEELCTLKVIFSASQDIMTGDFQTQQKDMKWLGKAWWQGTQWILASRIQQAGMNTADLFFSIFKIFK